MSREAPSSTRSAEPFPRRGVSARALLIGFLLTPLNVLFLTRALWIWTNITGAESLFTNTIAALFVLAALNQGLKRWRPHWTFAPGEILTIYLILSVGTGLTCSRWDLGGALSSYMTHAFWFATDENGWREALWPHLPTWLTVRDGGALAGLYMGDSQPYRLAVLRAWAAPALWWAGMLSAVMWVSLCLSSIVRRRWADQEKLAFPMAILPVQLADERFSLLTSKAFWLGLIVAAGIGTWNIVSVSVPALPAFPTRWNFETLAANNPPWNFLRFYDLLWNPWYLGLAYLIPLDLAFSLLAFNLLWSAEYVVSGHLGWCTNKWSGFPYGEQQTAGGFIALALMAVWLDRKFLLQVGRRAVGLRPPLPDEREEAFSYRTAVLGVAAGLGILWWLFLRAGIPTWVTWAFFANYFLMAMVICRLRAQLGPPSHQLYGAMPNWVLPALVGSRVLGPRSIGMMYLMRPFLEEQRNHPAPFQLEGLKMAEGGRMDRTRLAIALAIVPLLAILSYFWATLHIGYQIGMGTGAANRFHILIGRWGTEWMDSLLENPSRPDVSGSLAMALAFGATTALYFLKLRLHWWPLHPVAFPIAMSNTIANIAPALFAAWLTKGLLLRYGGLQAHRKALPFFLGMIAGDALRVTAAALWFELAGGGAGWDPTGI